MMLKNEELNMKTNELADFTTADIQVAAYLKSTNLPLLGVQKDVSGRSRFIFKNKTNCEERLVDYANNAKVPVRTLLSNLRDLKGLTLS